MNTLNKPYVIVRSGKYLQWFRQGRFCGVDCKARATKLRSRDAVNHSIKVMREKHGYTVEAEEE